MITAQRNGGSKAYELTWFAARNCWKKKYKAKVYYCPLQAQGKTDRDGYTAALAWWQEKRSQLDRKQQEQAGEQTGFGCFGDMTEAEFNAVGMHEDAKWHFHRKFGDDPPITLARWQELEAAEDYANEHKAREAEKIDPAMTVEKFVARFLDLKRSQAVAKQKSNGRFVNLRTNVKQFAEFVGNDRAANKVQWGLLLSDWYQKQLREITAGDLGEYGGRDKMQVARQFIRWLWERGIIDLPRNLDSKEMTIECEASAIKLPDFDVAKALVEEAPEIYADFYPLKLYLMLMANCGMTQKDIADLKQSEVDLKAGTIRRKRSKKQRSTAKNLPTVTYYLWPKTLELLKKHRSTTTENVLINRTGGSLRATTLNTNAEEMKASNTDLIADQWNDWLEKSKKDGFTLKALRKASSTRLETHAEFAKYSEYFLAQTPKGTTRKFYAVPSEERFAACLEWLRLEYGF